MKLSELSIPNLQRSASLAYYTTMRVGGPADALVVAETADELAGIVTELWKTDLPFMILGGGSNVLVSDAGVHGVVVINRTRPGEGFRFTEAESPDAEPPTVWAEAGVNFGALARQAALRGLSGLEWASGIPGTVGGAVIGNAGAHGSDMAGTLVVAEILHPIRGPPVVACRTAGIPLPGQCFERKACSAAASDRAFRHTQADPQHRGGGPGEDECDCGEAPPDPASWGQHGLDVSQPAGRLCRTPDRGRWIEGNLRWRS